MNKAACVMCCGGLDPSCGAGVTADFLAVTAQGVSCRINLTATTIQNNDNFLASYPLPASHFQKTAELILKEFHRPVVKTGMLPEDYFIEHLVELNQNSMLGPIVVDPVIFSSSGGRLISETALSSILEKLLPITSVFTPNVPEAQRLTGITISDDVSLIEAGKRLLQLGPRYVVIKGGHLSGDATDVLFTSSAIQKFKSLRLPGSARGTGCAFASSIAASLANKLDIESSVSLAKKYVQTLFK